MNPDTIIDERNVSVRRIASAAKRMTVHIHALTSKGMLSLLDQGLNSSSNFLTGIMVGRFCAREEFGLYSLGLSIILVCIDLQGSLIATPYMVYSPRLQGDARTHYAGNTLINQLMLSLLIMILLAGASVIALGSDFQRLIPVIQSLALVIAFILLKEFIRQICFTDLRMKMVLFLDAVVFAIQIGGILLTAFFEHLSATRVILLIGFSSCVPALGWFLHHRGQFKPIFSDLIPDLRRRWVFAKWLLASGILWTATMNLYPWIIMKFEGIAAAGIWAACLGVLAIANPFLLGLQNYFGPKIARTLVSEGEEGMRRHVFHCTLISSAFMLVFCLIMLLTGDRILVLLYGPKYSGYGFTVFILALSLLVSSLSFPISRGLFTLGRADLDFKINMVGILVMLVVGISLVKALGVQGSAYGLLISNVIGTSLKGILFVRMNPARG